MPNRIKKKKKTGVPKRWLDYTPFGNRIPGTRFIAFKVPLTSSVYLQVPKKHAFDMWDLLAEMDRQKQQLGLIIDLTYSTKYYTPADVPTSCSYIKIFIEGHRVPNDTNILKFKQIVRAFLKANEKNDKLIGVHCTHGINRTGYLICRYLIDVDGVNPTAALKLFNSSRGHCIERKNYRHDLLHAAKRSNIGMDKPREAPIRGLAEARPPPRPETKTQQSSTPQNEQEHQPSGSVTTEKEEDDEEQLHVSDMDTKMDTFCDKSTQNDLV